MNVFSPSLSDLRGGISADLAHYWKWESTKISNRIIAAAVTAIRPALPREKKLMFGTKSGALESIIDLSQRLRAYR